MAPMKTETMKTEIVAGEEFWVPQTYTAVGKLGAGAYGVVAEFKDESGRSLAVKKFFGLFDKEEDLLEARRCLREIKLLRALKHENVVELVDVFVPASFDFKSVFVVLSFVETDLHSVIRSDEELSYDHIKFFAYQIFRGLKYIHSANVVHRDIKPRNLLVNRDCDLCICDFGLSRVMTADLQPCAMGPFVEVPNEDEEDETTAYTDATDDEDDETSSNCSFKETLFKRELTPHDVVTLWYRAPEIIVSRYYSFPVDVFSVGCVVAELVGRKALFRSQHAKAHFEMIMEYVGIPSEHELSNLNVCDEFLDNVESAMERVRTAEDPVCVDGHTDWSAVYPKADQSMWTPELTGLLQWTLAFNPNSRPSAVDALAHPFMGDLSEPTDEPTCEDRIDWEFDNDSRLQTEAGLHVAIARERTVSDERECMGMGRRMSERRNSGLSVAPYRRASFFSKV
eukprot:TRINITY_DN8421_c0_g1_i2.p1 TRINITY_DN8421_c0_g1~~TRINITY_DN8421_c0_g1_i2.p1  ORF type:complete len:454 (+),score=67.59 TRINITY_DN8421_c0_g1_i2:50-1411(+)